MALAGCSSTQDTKLVAKNGEAGAFILENVPELKPGQARVFSFVDEKPGLLFRARSGELGAVNAVCTHLGCTVEWVEGAQAKAAFRCPCHESQFASGGQTLGGPAKKPLPAFEARDLGDGKIELRLKSV